MSAVIRRQASWITIGAEINLFDLSSTDFVWEVVKDVKYSYTKETQYALEPTVGSSDDSLEELIENRVAAGRRRKGQSAWPIGDHYTARRASSWYPKASSRTSSDRSSRWNPSISSSSLMTRGGAL